MSQWRPLFHKWWWWISGALFCSPWIMILCLKITMPAAYKRDGLGVVGATIALLLLVAWLLWTCWLCIPMEASNLMSRTTYTSSYTPRIQMRNYRLGIWLPAIVFLLLGLYATFMVAFVEWLCKVIRGGFPLRLEKVYLSGLWFVGIALLMALGCWWLAKYANRRFRHTTLLRKICYDCGYDLRGTIAANRSSCPECGKAFPAIHNPEG